VFEASWEDFGIVDVLCIIVGRVRGEVVFSCSSVLTEGDGVMEELGSKLLGRRERAWDRSYPDWIAFNKTDPHGCLLGLCGARWGPRPISDFSDVSCPWGLPGISWKVSVVLPEEQVAPWEQ